jgi:hypothetical protein
MVTACQTNAQQEQGWGKNQRKRDLMFHDEIRGSGLAKKGSQNSDATQPEATAAQPNVASEELPYLSSGRSRSDRPEIFMQAWITPPHERLPASRAA